jgi:hypothetical protein
MQRSYAMFLINKVQGLSACHSLKKWLKYKLRNSEFCLSLSIFTVPIFYSERPLTKLVSSPLELEQTIRKVLWTVINRNRNSRINSTIP